MATDMGLSVQNFLKEIHPKGGYDSPFELFMDSSSAIHAAVVPAMLPKFKHATLEHRAIKSPKCELILIARVADQRRNRPIDVFQNLTDTRLNWGASSGDRREPFVLGWAVLFHLHEQCVFRYEADQVIGKAVEWHVGEGSFTACFVPTCAAPGAQAGVRARACVRAATP